MFRRRVATDIDARIDHWRESPLVCVKARATTRKALLPVWAKFMPIMLMFCAPSTHSVVSRCQARRAGHGQASPLKEMRCVALTCTMSGVMCCTTEALLLGKSTSVYLSTKVPTPRSSVILKLGCRVPVWSRSNSISKAVTFCQQVNSHLHVYLAETPSAVTKSDGVKLACLAEIAQTLEFQGAWMRALVSCMPLPYITAVTSR